MNHKQEGTCFVLDLAVLGLLKETPMSGYELKKQLSVKLGAFWRVSYGSLYPCLKRLAADGALDVEVSPFTSRKKHVSSCLWFTTADRYRCIGSMYRHDRYADASMSTRVAIS